MLRSTRELLQWFVIDGDSQIDNRRVTVARVGTRKLLEVLVGNLSFARSLIIAHSGDQSDVDVRVDQARNKKVSLSLNYRCAGGLLCICSPFHAHNLSVFDRHAAVFDVIELLREIMLTSVIQVRFDSWSGLAWAIAATGKSHANVDDEYLHRRARVSA
jgi:hypothetical protein